MVKRVTELQEKTTVVGSDELIIIDSQAEDNKVKRTRASTLVDVVEPIVEDVAQPIVEDIINPLIGQAESARDDAVIAKEGAEDALASAVAVVFQGDASITPAPGKIPVANEDGKIDPGWIDGLDFDPKIYGNFRKLITRFGSGVQNRTISIFVYDTRKDIDGGKWTENSQYTSWYNEPTESGKFLGVFTNESSARNSEGSQSGDFYQQISNNRFYRLEPNSGVTQIYRGRKKEFPKIALVAIGSSSSSNPALIIYDLTEKDTPMWMVFLGNNNFIGESSAGTSLSMSNGCLTYGGHGFYDSRIINFIEDRVEKFTSSGNDIFFGKISQRNSVNRWDQYKTIDRRSGVKPHSWVHFDKSYPFSTLSKLPQPLIISSGSSRWNVDFPDGSFYSSAGFTESGRVITSDKFFFVNDSNGLRYSWNLLKPPFNSFSTTTIPDELSVSISNHVIPRGNYSLMVEREILSRRKNIQHIILNKENRFDSMVYSLGWMCNSGYGKGSPIFNLISHRQENQGSFNSNIFIENPINVNDSERYTFSSGFVPDINNPIRVNRVSGTVRWMRIHGVTPGKIYRITGRIDTGNTTAITIRSGDFSVNVSRGQDFTVSLYANLDYIELWQSTSAVGYWEFTSFEVEEDSIIDETSILRGYSVTGTPSKLSVSNENILSVYSDFYNDDSIKSIQNYSSYNVGTNNINVSAWVNIDNNYSYEGLGGDEVMSNIDLTSGWSGGGTTTIVNQNTFSTSSSSGNGVSIDNLLVIGKLYRLRIGVNIDNGVFRVVNNFGAASGIQIVPDSQSGVYEGTFVAQATSMYIRSVDGPSNVEITEFDLVEANIPSIVHYGHESGPQWGLNIFNDRIMCFVDDGSSRRELTVSNPIITGKWNLFSFDYNSTTGDLFLYENGKMIGTNAGSPVGSLTNNNAIITLGNNYWGDSSIGNTKISMVKASSSVLSQEQHEWVYSVESPMFNPDANCFLPNSSLPCAVSYDEYSDSYAVSTGNTISLWKGCCMVEILDEIPTSGYVGELSFNSGILAASIQRDPEDRLIYVYEPSDSIRESIINSDFRRHRNIEIFKQFIGDGSETNFKLPLDFGVVEVYLDGAYLREGSTADYELSHDGFNETVQFAVAPPNGARIDIKCVMETNR